MWHYGGPDALGTQELVRRFTGKDIPERTEFVDLSATVRRLRTWCAAAALRAALQHSLTPAWRSLRAGWARR